MPSARLSLPRSQLQCLGSSPQTLQARTSSTCRPEWIAWTNGWTIWRSEWIRSSERRRPGSMRWGAPRTEPSPYSPCLQLKRSTEGDTIVNLLRETNQVVESFTRHFRDQYKHVRDFILTFRNLSRMDWTRLTSQEGAAATRALTTFETIPQSVLDAILTEENEKNRYELADIYQLLGVSAFYTNDIDAAVKCLQRALQIYGIEDAPAEHLFQQAFCSHFLGLAEKNWWNRDRPQEANLASARRHLEDATRRLEMKDGEFLTPLTLAEILSYSAQSRDAARKNLDSIVSRLTKLKEAIKLDENQHALLGRALLLRGNVDYVDRDLAQALSWYHQAHEHSRENAYALLSMAQATSAGESAARVRLFQQGLQLLEDPSGALNKRETSVRVSALAWAVIAAREICYPEFGRDM